MQRTLLTLDQKNTRLKKARRRADTSALSSLDEQVRLSWVFHDHGVDGFVVTESELVRATQGELGKGACEQLILDGIARLYAAVETVRGSALEERTIDLSDFKRVHVLCAPPADPNAGRYRKVDGPIGTYLHQCPPPKAISYRLRKLVDSLEELALVHPVRAAVTVHHEFMNIFPFDHLTGRAGRLLLNYWLMREGYPPTIIPTSRRAEYYNALVDPEPMRLLSLVIEAMDANLEYSLAFLARRTDRAAVAA